MDLLDSKTDKALVESLLQEIAKASNEIACARKDLEKANGRIRFLLVLTHTLLNRQGD